MTKPPNGDSRRQSFLWFLWLGSLTVFYAVSLLGWPMAFMIVNMACSDYIGPSSPPIAGGNIPILLTAIYPYVVIIGLVCAWALFSVQRYHGAFWASLVPFANILLVFLGVALLALVLKGHF